MGKPIDIDPMTLYGQLTRKQIEKLARSQRERDEAEEKVRDGTIILTAGDLMVEAMGTKDTNLIGVIALSTARMLLGRDTLLKKRGSRSAGANLG